MVVVDQIESVLVGDFAELVQASGEKRPFLILEDGLVLEDADIADALHRAGLLGDHDACGTQELQVFAGGAEVWDDGLNAVADDEGGEPLGMIFRPAASAFSFVSSFEGYQPATSVPAKPASARSSNMMSMVFHSPTSGMSSLRHAIGCMPHVMPFGSKIAVAGS